MQNRVSNEVDRHGVLSSRGRKMAPTGGNRSWSEEEENYLLQTRLQKMPYKHIAAHLKKTELACRLHYHQLSHGSHRRKRTASLSSASSGGSVRHSPSQYHLNGEHHIDYSNHAALHGSPNHYGSLNSVIPYGSNTSPGRTQHKLLLPKPRPITPDDSPTRLQGLRINTSGSSPQGSSVDTDRLRQIYDNHRNSFWGAIASEYGSDVSAGQLEEVWRQAPVGHHPPTPEDSPNSRMNQYPILQPSPFPSYATTMHQPRKDYVPIHLASNGPSPIDRYNYAMPTPVLANSYAHAPNLGGLSRHSSWTNGNNGPPTAISSLLTEDRCPRHTENTRYAVGGH
ncbi:hypothetical protein EJ08DRAFT_581817 [Tothia fuscella]|uniref:Myb-like domain-containing protein n=1 Tax=Tothia fuscella TaxID=1048955 RepID=A0A9P4P044_9PEZI|nr:hypothetical protein EJ08DRAFT_581817 [Tothia fuscella]